MDTVWLSGDSAVEYTRDESQGPIFFFSWLNVTGINPGLELPAVGRGWCSPPRFTKKDRGIVQDKGKPALCLKSKSSTGGGKSMLVFKYTAQHSLAQPAVRNGPADSFTYSLSEPYWLNIYTNYNINWRLVLVVCFYTLQLKASTKMMDQRVT